MDRRTFLRAAPAAGAALVAPAVALAAKKPVLTQEERIAAGIAEIVAAFREKYPDCPIRVCETDNRNSGMLLFLTNIGDDAPGTVTYHKSVVGSDEVKIVIDDGSPLRADDVTGTTAYADWEARKSA